MAPPMKFASSYQAQSEKRGVNIDATLDRSLRSYMDSGEALFANEKVAGRKRKDIITDVRKNILKRMKQENAASVDSAKKQRTAHQSETAKLVGSVSELAEKRKSAMEAEEAYYDLVQQQAEATGLSKVLHLYRPRIATRRWTMLSRFKEVDDKRESVRKEAGKWNTDKQPQYRENVFRKHYNDYDALAKTWYELTREYERPTAAAIAAAAAGPLGPNAAGPTASSTTGLPTGTTSTSRIEIGPMLAGLSTDDIRQMLEDHEAAMIRRAQDLKGNLPDYARLVAIDAPATVTTTVSLSKELSDLERYENNAAKFPNIVIPKELRDEIKFLRSECQDIIEIENMLRQAENDDKDSSAKGPGAPKDLEDDDDKGSSTMGPGAPKDLEDDDDKDSSTKGTGTPTDLKDDDDDKGSSTMGTGVPAPAPQKDPRRIPKDASKKIMEYTGIYDLDMLDNTLDAVIGDPDVLINAGSFNIVDFKGRQAQTTRFDPVNHTNIHTGILMYSRPDGQTGLRTRYKFDRKLMGRMAKKQFTAAHPDIPTALDPSLVDATEHLAEELELESDERDVDGRYLFSEKSAEIVTARLKRNGETVRGFYLNGQFVTDEDASSAPKGEVAGKEGMKWRGTPNWDKREKAEKLRVAIRKSVFFQHVNARTIQYYASYQAEEYTQAIGSAVNDRIAKAGGGANPQTPDEARDLLLRAAPRYSLIKPALMGPAIAGYVVARIDPSYRPPRGVAPFPLGNPGKDTVIAHAITAYPKEVVFACLMMLSDDSNPRLWTIARDITEANRYGISARTVSKLDYLPKSGELMRMSLMEELSSHQAWNSEFSRDDLDLLGALDLPNKKVLQEELDTRRGTGNWFKRNLLNGNIVRQLMRAGEVGIEMAGAGSDIGKKYGEGWGNEEERAERRFWFNYAEGMSDMTSTFSIFSTMFTAAAFMGGGAEAAADMRDLSFDVMNVSEAVGAIVRMLSDAWRMVQRVRKWWHLRKPENAQEKHETLEDLDYNGLHTLLRALDSFYNCLNCIRDIASIHVTTGSGDLSAVQNDNWGEVLKSKGLLDKIFTNIRRLIRFVDDCREIHASRMRKGRIDDANTDIETAVASIKGLTAADFAHIDGRIDLRRQVKEQTGTEAVFGATPEEDKALEASDRQAQMGRAATENSQAQFLMSYVRSHSNTQIAKSSFNMAVNTLEAVDDIVDSVKALPLLRVFTLAAPKVVEFAGWITTTGMERSHLTTSIEKTLGDKEFASFRYPYFDDVLKRETGIVNKHYLTDLARIFASIDSHAMIMNPNATQGEKDLGMKMAATMYGNVNEDSVKKLKLEELMRYAGVEQPESWRSILRNSLMA